VMSATVGCVDPTRTRTSDPVRRARESPDSQSRPQVVTVVARRGWTSGGDAPGPLELGTLSCEPQGHAADQALAATDQGSQAAQAQVRRPVDR
jgi:hypothetical protein